MDRLNAHEKSLYPAKTVAIGEFFWGYGSGIIVVKVPDWGEFVLAELTQPFDKSDVSYFFPLMATNRAKDWVFDPDSARLTPLLMLFTSTSTSTAPSDPEAFAAVPFSEKGGYKSRKFSPQGLPICAAGLPMPFALHLHRSNRYYCRA
ncbi:MAG: hypothetical protein MZU91_02200 [Desulfosudis oleivorans]|nr:hypothetical protein [Desulfosudis oleivorans]